MSAEKTVTYLSDHASSGAITSSGKRGVLFSPRTAAAAGDDERARPFQGSSYKPAGRHVITKMSGDRRRPRADARPDGSALRIGRQVTAVGVEHGLIDAGKIAVARASRATNSKNRRARLNSWRMLAGGSRVR